MTIGQDAKALEALKACLKLIYGWDTEGGQWRKSREVILNDIEVIESRNK